MDKHLHIVAHDVPWPVAHGGMFDIFYKIVALHSSGVKVHLHCFKKKGRQEEPELKKYCASVDYYTRHTGISGVSLTLPYIVRSRFSAQLIANMQKDNYPVLLEGIHCTAILQDNCFKGRKILVRLHNVEYRYYEQLAMHELNIFKKLYYSLESSLLKKYERTIAGKAHFLAVSEADEAIYKKEFNAAIDFLPVFLPYHEVKAVPGKGEYCLYHGNLSVNENEKAAIWLLNEVFQASDKPFIIAGRDPSATLIEIVEKNPSASIVADPGEQLMQELIKMAHINILPSFNATGVKLKLLNALYNGRHCLVNEAAVEGSGLTTLCTIAESTAGFREEINRLYPLPFEEVQIKQRSEMLKHLYNSETNVRRIMTWIW